VPTTAPTEPVGLYRLRHRPPGPRAPTGPHRGDAAHVRPSAGVAHESVGGEGKATTAPTAEATVPTTPRILKG
jgi:hypothetical protein